MDVGQTGQPQRLPVRRDVGVGAGGREREGGDGVTVATLRHTRVGPAMSSGAAAVCLATGTCTGPPPDREEHAMPRQYVCLWFDRQAEDAANFYTSVFPNSSIGPIARYPEDSGERAGEVLTVAFELDGVPYVGAQRRAAVHLRRGHLDHHRLCGPGRDRPLLGRAHGRRWRGGAVRLAQGQVRPVVAGRAAGLGRDLLDRPRAGRQGLRRDDDHEEARHRRARGGRRRLTRSHLRRSVTRPTEKAVSAVGPRV